jgi:hypothetical protein
MAMEIWTVNVCEGSEMLSGLIDYDQLRRIP